MFGRRAWAGGAVLDDIALRFEQMPWWEYRRFDQEHRRWRYSSHPWVPDWQAIRPLDVAVLTRRSGRPLVAAGLLSMHPSGYVREAAVDELAAMAVPDVWPFLLVRTADWVEPVRAKAQTAVRQRLEPSQLEVLLAAAPLLDQMIAEGARTTDFAAEVLDWLRTNLPAATLLNHLTDDSPLPRRWCARLLAARGDISEQALTIALHQGDVVVACIIGVAAIDQVAPLTTTLAALWGSSVAYLRALALHRYEATGQPLARSTAQVGLLDPSPPVRFLAQHLLRQQGVDLQGHYRRELPDRPVAIQGLAEVGDAADASIIEPYLTDPRPRVRAIAVHALARLLGSDSRPVLLAALDDPSPTVMRTATKALAGQQLDPATLDDLWARTTSTQLQPLRRAAFRVFLRQSRWPKVVIVLRALASADDDLQHRGHHLLTSLQTTWNQSYTRPTPTQIDELTNLAPIAGHHLTDTVHHDLQDLLRHTNPTNTAPH